jgi:hypothetical protein
MFLLSSTCHKSIPAAKKVVQNAMKEGRSDNSRPLFDSAFKEVTKHLESGTVDQKFRLEIQHHQNQQPFLFETALANATGALGHQHPFQSLLGPTA